MGFDGAVHCIRFGLVKRDLETIRMDCHLLDVCSDQ